MEDEVLLWKEKLAALLKGSSLPVEKDQSVYSAIRQNPDLFKNKSFTIRTHKSTLLKRVYRIK